MSVDYKTETNKILLDYYEKNGFVKTVKTAKAMYKVNLKTAKPDFKTDLCGEICETILEIGIIEFMKKYPEICRDWVIKKGLIVKDIENPNNGFLTEIDLVLATPQMIYIFECKSYTGEKILTDICTIKTKNRSFDVYKQNLMHARVFLKQFDPYRVNKAVKKLPLQLALFSLSKGSITDKRNDTSKMLMPLVEIENLFKFLSQNIPTTDREVISLWKMKYVKNALDIIAKKSDANRSAHLAYVKNLHNQD